MTGGGHPPAPLPPDGEEVTAKVERPALSVRVVLRDVRTSQVLEATATRVRVGRSADCEIALAVGPSEGVSRTHCEFGIDGYGSIVVMDSGSTNGTLLNGRRLDAPSRAAPLQALALGDSGPTLVIEALELIVPGKRPAG